MAHLATPSVQALALGVGCVVVALLTLAPVVMPRPSVPVVSRAALPEVRGSTMGASSAEASQEPPSYSTTASITPLISGRLNLNTATQEQLEALPDVGPALAQRIIAGRPYRSLKDLDAVKGVGTATLKKLAPLLTF